MLPARASTRSKEEPIRTTMKKDFAQCMRSRLGYQSCALDFPVIDAEASRTRFASVRGETYGIAWYRLRSAAAVLLAASLLSRVLIPLGAGDTPVVATSLAYLALGSYLLAHWGRVHSRQYSWVECKDLERPLTREDLVLLKDTFEGVRRSAAATWKPVKVLVVAGAHGFDEAAMSAARVMGMECYQRADGDFRKVA